MQTGKHARWISRGTAAAAVAAAWALGACADVDVDERRYACEQDPDCGAGFVCAPDGVCARTGEAVAGAQFPMDLHVFITAAGPHLGEIFDARVVSASGVLRSRAIIDVVLEADFDFRVPSTIPEAGGPHVLDFFFDSDRTGEATEIPINHQWTRPIEGEVFTFAHEGVFDPIEPPLPIGGDFSIELTGFAEAFQGKRLELFVYENSAGRCVGFYRKEAIPFPAELRAAKDPPGDAEGGQTVFTLKIPGIVDAGSPYRVQLYVDENGNGRFDSGVDPSWVVETVAQQDLTVKATAADPQSPLVE